MEFDTQLKDRSTEIKEKKNSSVIIFQIDSLKKHYDESIKNVNEQFNIADELLECDRISACQTIWRAQVVLLESSFDYFMHEVIWYGLKKIYDDDWKATDRYNKLTITLDTLKKILDDVDDGEWFNEYIINQFKSQTLMDKGDIKKYLDMIGIKISEVARRSFYEAGSNIKPEKKLNNFLDDLYRRRNWIAHQSDRSMDNAELKSISKEDVESYIDNVNKIVNGIVEILKEKEIS